MGLFVVLDRSRYVVSLAAKGAKSLPLRACAMQAYCPHTQKVLLLCLTIAPNNHDFDMQSLEGVTLPRTVAVRRPQ